MDDVRPITPEQSTAVAVAEPPRPAVRAPVPAGAPVLGIIPRDAEEAARLAGAIVDSGMVPDSYQGGDNRAVKARVLIGILKGLEIGLPPITALGTICVVNNKPCLWGDGAVALIQQSGKLEWMTETVEGTENTDDWTAVCTMKRVGQAEPYIGRFSYGDAKRARLTNKGPWRDYPKRMLSWRAFAWPARKGFADVLSGLAIVEEARDIAPPPPPVTDTSFLDAGMPAALPTPSTETPAEGQAAAPTAPATGATIAPGAAADLLAWCPSAPKTKDDAAFKADQIRKRLAPLSLDDRMAWIGKHHAMHAAIIKLAPEEADALKAFFEGGK